MWIVQTLITGLAAVAGILFLSGCADGYYGTNAYYDAYGNRYAYAAPYRPYGYYYRYYSPGYYGPYGYNWRPYRYYVG